MPRGRPLTDSHKQKMQEGRIAARKRKLEDMVAEEVSQASDKAISKRNASDLAKTKIKVKDRVLLKKNNDPSWKYDGWEGVVVALNPTEGEILVRSPGFKGDLWFTLNEWIRR